MLAIRLCSVAVGAPRRSMFDRPALSVVSLPSRYSVAIAPGGPPSACTSPRSPRCTSASVVAARPMAGASSSAMSTEANGRERRTRRDIRAPRTGRTVAPSMAHRGRACRGPGSLVRAAGCPGRWRTMRRLPVAAALIASACVAAPAAQAGPVTPVPGLPADALAVMNQPAYASAQWFVSVPIWPRRLGRLAEARTSWRSPARWSRRTAWARVAALRRRQSRGDAGQAHRDAVRQHAGREPHPRRPGRPDDGRPDEARRHRRLRQSRPQRREPAARRDAHAREPADRADKWPSRCGGPGSGGCRGT